MRRMRNECSCLTLDKHSPQQRGQMLIGIPGVPVICECPAGHGPQSVGSTEGKEWRTLVNS